MPLFSRRQSSDVNSSPASGPGSSTGEQDTVGNAGILQRLFGRGEDASQQQNAGDGEYPAAPSLDEIRGGAVLKQGHEGPAVTAIQQWLTKLGFGVQASGKLGPTTVGVLQQFQTAYKVQATGQVGPTTLDVVERAQKSAVQLEDLMKMMPNLSEEKAREYLPHLNFAMFEANINSDARKAAFIAQLGHESLGLTAFEEFASGADYEGRRDLGNTQRGDGKRYKGRGPIQLTGRANYRTTGEALGVDLENDPTRASDPDVGFRIAGHFWESKGLNEHADQGNFDTITKRINGGQRGRADRRSRWGTAKKVLSDRKQAGG